MEPINITSEFNLERHVLEALQNAQRIADGPINAAHILMAVTNSDFSGRSHAFQKIGDIIGHDQSKIPTRKKAIVMGFQLSSGLLESYSIAKQVWKKTGENVWGRDLITMALLAIHEPSLDEFLKERGHSLVTVLEEWYNYIMDDPKHRSKAVWNEWWRAAGVQPPFSQMTFLLNWNPNLYTIDRFREALKNAKEKGPIEIGWSTGNRTHVSIGDRVYLIRLADKKKGIVGSGEIIGPVTKTLHWNPERSKKGDNYNRVLVHWDVLEEEPIVTFDELNRIEKTFVWDNQAGGIEIPFETAEKLEAAWLDANLNRIPPESGPKINEQVKLQTESLNVEDKLGRQSFVTAIKTYIESLWRDKKDSYSLHLGGEWGSGKSKVLDMLAKDLRNDNWVVVEFNAWQNQHIELPWWIFMDNVYKGIQNSPGHKRGIWWKERWWRLIELNKIYWVSFLGLVAFFVILNSASGFTLLNLGSLIDDSKSGGKTISVITSYITIIGTIWVLFKAVSGSLIPASTSAAKEFKTHVRDPMYELKRHFTKIINYTNRNIAIFIDDIDRCNTDFVVNLLEGVQTLFRSAKVFYIVAGDGNWIKKSFELYYEDLEDVVQKQGHSVGNFFLEKTFQMSISIPRISEETLEQYWKYLLSEQQQDAGSDDALESDVKKQEYQEEKEELVEAIRQANNEIEIDTVVQNAKTPVQKIIAREEAVKRMSEKESILGDVEHKLQGYHKLLEPNPRSMKRLINNYALERSSLILAGIGFHQVSDDALIRWVILKSRFPLIADSLNQNSDSLDQVLADDKSGTLKELTDGLDTQTLAYCVNR